MCDCVVFVRLLWLNSNKIICCTLRSLQLRENSMLTHWDITPPPHEFPTLDTLTHYTNGTVNCVYKQRTRRSTITHQHIPHQNQSNRPDHQNTSVIKQFKVKILNQNVWKFIKYEVRFSSNVKLEYKSCWSLHQSVICFNGNIVRSGD